MPRQVRRPSPALVVATVALIASLGGAAFATIPAKDGDVHACYSKSTGEIELVDTQRDSFDCERNWRGLTIDTEPTKLVSPNGQFRVDVTNTGIALKGPSALVKLTPAKVLVDSDGVIDVKAAGIVDVDGSLVRINGTPQSGN